MPSDEQTPAKKRPSASIYLDPRGVPISVYGVIQGQHVGEQRSIVAVAEKGLDYWNLLSRREAAVLLSYSWEEGRDLRTIDGRDALVGPEQGMVNCADWLLDNLDGGENYAVWRYAYPSFFGTSPGWRSAHAQGQAIQLLLRAYETTGEERYLEPVRPAVNAFFRTVEEDGLTERLGPGRWWYHKFADIECEQPFVLNGMLFAMLGLHDAYRRTQDARALELFEKGVGAVAATLAQFDKGEWSSYTPGGKPATRHYHWVHCQQLASIVDVTANAVLSETLERWRRGDTTGATGGTW